MVWRFYTAVGRDKGRVVSMNRSMLVLLLAIKGSLSVQL